jgi:hypothetical protein
LVVELEAYNRAEKRNYARSTTIEPVDDRTASALEDLWAKLESLQNEMRELKAQWKESSPQARQKDSNQTSGTQKLCYFCRKPGHMRKDCRAYMAQSLISTKLIKVKPGHKSTFCGNRFQTKDEWNAHTVQCARNRREKLTFECAECDYAAKRERDLKRHVETRHRADSREKIDKGKDPGNPHEFIGLVNLSRKLMVAGEKEKSADDFSAFEPPWKVGRVKQQNAPDMSKTKSKLTADSRRKSSSADKHHKGKPKKMVSICTQTHRCCPQAGSTEVQTEGPDRCGSRMSPVEKLTRLSVTRVVTHRDDNQKIGGRG